VHSNLPYNFDRTYRVPVEAASDEIVSEESAQGTGLGLAITRRIVELHGCQISVQSNLGQGATFDRTFACSSSCVELPELRVRQCGAHSRS
jgi:signal transduction histidine kinase